MPELPEVTIVVKQLNKVISKKTIIDIKILRNKLVKEIPISLFKKSLINQTIRKITNRGKFIVFHFKSNTILLSHLRMEGKYFYYLKTVLPKKHVHIVFKFSDKSELHYMDTRIFGTFHIRNKENYLNTLPLKKVALEPINANYNNIYKILSKKKTAIKTSLLDQTILAGLGNIYVDEVLFITKINPLTPANKLNPLQIKEIIITATKIFKLSIAMGGSSINTYTSLNNKQGKYQNKLNVHMQKGKPCKICNALIEKIKVNGRGTYYCKNCQKKY